MAKEPLNFSGKLKLAQRIRESLSGRSVEEIEEIVNFLHKVLGGLELEKIKELLVVSNALKHILPSDVQSVIGIIKSEAERERARKEVRKQLFMEQAKRLVDAKVYEDLGMEKEQFVKMMLEPLLEEALKVEDWPDDPEKPGRFLFLIVIPPQCLTISKMVRLLSIDGKPCRVNDHFFFLQGLIGNSLGVDFPGMPYLLKHVDVGGAKDVNPRSFRNHLKIISKRPLTVSEGLNLAFQYPEVVKLYKAIYFLGSALGASETIPFLLYRENAEGGGGETTFFMMHPSDHNIPGFAPICGGVVKIDV